MAITLSQVITPSLYNKGLVTRSGINFLPIQTKDGKVNAVISNLGNIHSLSVDGNKGPVEMTQCALDFGNGDIDIHSLKMMGQVRGLTPAGFPLFGRTTELANGRPVTDLAGINGWRSLTPEVYIHGVGHNRIWELNDLGSGGDNHKVSIGFDTNWFQNADLSKVFPKIKVEREYTVKSTKNGGEVEVETTILNNGDSPIQIVFGDHSYLNTLERDKWELFAEADNIWETDPANNGVTTGNLLDSTNFLKGESLNGLTYDATQIGLTRTMGPENFSDAILTNTETGIKIIVRQSEGFSNRGVFIPANENYVCIEPIVAPPNAIKISSVNQKAIPLTLKPGVPVKLKEVFSLENLG